MSVNAVGAHGRDVSAVEQGWFSSAAAPPSGPISFADVVDALNPLQYLPLVGSIYRVCTGDEGSPTLRTAVSMISGLLLGGPVGLLTNIGGAVLEHFLPVEQIARGVLTGKPAATQNSPAPVQAKASPAATPAALSAPVAPVAAAATAAYARVQGVGRSG